MRLRSLVSVCIPIPFMILILPAVLAGCGGVVAAGDDSHDAGIEVAVSPEASVESAPAPDPSLPTGSCVSTSPADTPLDPMSTSASQLHSLMIGRWVQYQGECIAADRVGMEFTETEAWNLTRSPDGGLLRAEPLGSWTLVATSSGLAFKTPSFMSMAPVMFDKGKKMHALFNPWYTNLQRAP